MNILIYILILALTSNSSYLIKGVQNLYEDGAPVYVKTRKLKSHRNLPFDVYQLPYCAPDGVSTSSKNEAENIGELLFGDRLKSSVYTFLMKEEVKCAMIDAKYCERSAGENGINADDSEVIRTRISEEYNIELVADRLPIASVLSADGCHFFLLGDTGDDVTYSIIDGFPVGCEENGKFYVNNHLSFNIKYHEEEEGASIIAVEVVASSAKDLGGCFPNSEKFPPKSIVERQVVEKDEKIRFSYSVHWEESEKRWSSRWDNYLQSGQTNIHWYSIINSCLIVLFLSGMIAMIMIRILHKDIAKYNLEEADPDERGWKLVHSEVFRPPVMRSLLAVFLGVGMQVFGICACSLPLAALGIFSPNNRGYLFTAILVLYFLMALPAGFFALRFYKLMDGERWKLTTVILALLLPVLVFVVFLIFDVTVWLGADSSIALPFLYLLMVVGLWICIYLPLCFLGAWLGWRRDKMTLPCDVAKIPRQLPKQPFWNRPLITVCLGGVLPFGAVFVELFFVMTSVWMNKMYFLFGFLFLIFVILLVVTSEITIVLIYLQLCNEDYRWWWRSFLTGGFASVYVFFFSIYYFITLEPSGVFLGVVYFGYMTLITLLFYALLGTSGFIATLLFIRRIYGSIRID